MPPAAAASSKRVRQARRNAGPGVYLWLFLLAASIVFLTHAPFLKVPYYWDELGQFVPAALDLFRAGAWIPFSTIPNAHPPAVMAYLALFWSVTGYSVAASRAAMLLVAAAALLAAFLLAIELCRTAPGKPAFLAAALLCVSPLFFAQSMMVLLDMPAMLFTSLALLLFLREKIGWAAVACTALVLVKETGVLVPAVLCLWLLYERRFRPAAYFLLPAAALAAWLGFLYARTGHLFGNAEFERFNVQYALHPVRAAVALARRLLYLFISDFHWIGTIAILFALRCGKMFHCRAWKIAGTLVAAHVLILSAIGGAALERYMLPVLPLLYTAMAAALEYWPVPLRLAAQTTLALGLIAGNVWNPPYPFPFENNLAFTDFTDLQQTAAGFLARRYPDKRIATVWPLAAALRRPEFGYVGRPLTVSTIQDFRPATLKALKNSPADVLVVYCRTWDPEWNLMRFHLPRAIWTRYYGYEPDVPVSVLVQEPWLEHVAQWSRRGQWIAVFRRVNEP